MPIIPTERIASHIYFIRNQKVMVDNDPAARYGVTTSALNQQLKRNANRFPIDFAFQLTEEEFQPLISQSVTSKGGRGGRRTLPMVFTEQGVAMLSSVLRGEFAAQVNVAIMRTFVKLRELLATNRDLAQKIEEHDRKITVLFDTVEQMLNPPLPKNSIGFVAAKSQ